MKLKTLQWNIGGGKIRDIDSDPTQGIGSLVSSYSLDGLDYIISKIKEWNVDIITFQETHADKNIIQAKVIAEKLGFPYWTNDKYDNSHIEDGQDLCQSIVSQYPIGEHSFKLFNNPLFEVKVPSGDIWISHDKGYTSSEITLPNDKTLEVGTLHLAPFHRFLREYNDPEVIEVLKDVSEKIESNIKELTLVQGDFNIDDASLKSHLPELLKILNEVETIDPTTPRGRKYDHILYKGLILKKIEIYKDVLTDHYPIISEFEI